MTPQFLDPQPFSELVNDLSTNDQNALQQGQVVIKGEAGAYVARILVSGSPEVAWEVLTDYDNFPRFLPNVAATDILTESGQRTIVEQTNTCRVLLANIESHVRTENITSSESGKIQFRMLEGDLEELQGYWQVLPLSHPSDHVLLQQVVTAEANIGLLEGSFHSIFEETLRKNLEAIQVEINLRLSTSPRKAA